MDDAALHLCNEIVGLHHDVRDGRMTKDEQRAELNTYYVRALKDLLRQAENDPMGNRWLHERPHAEGAGETDNGANAGHEDAEGVEDNA
jgi:hypothetical protein